MRLACDTGGTFTDLLVEENGGSWWMTKASTVAEDPAQGVLNALRNAADARNLSLADFLAPAEMLIHGTTHALNAVVTSTAAKTALIVTEGHREILMLREGGRASAFAFGVEYPKPYVPRALTYEVTERIDSSGEVRLPLDQKAVVALCDKLVEDGVEAVAVCLLWSIVNPAHELAIGEILARKLPGIPVTLSHSLNSTPREFRRASAAAIDASLKPLMGVYLGNLSTRLREAGFRGQLLVSTSQGGMLHAEDIAKKPILSMNSGPSTAPVAGRWYADRTTELKDVIVADTGGTTFDFSLVRNGRIPLTRESWIGGAHKGPMTGFPSVDVRSIGAGGGSLAWVDGGGLLRVGPLSAGAKPGPACYGRGGEKPTITDAALILGFLDPERFRAVGMVLDAEAAGKAMDVHVASKLGITVEQAATSVIRLSVEAMAQAVNDLVVSQGGDARRSVFIGGGGAGGLNAAFVARQLGCPTILIPEVGAALSAAGAILSDVVHEVRAMQHQITNRLDKEAAQSVLSNLRESCLAFARETGVSADKAKIHFAAETRYPSQVWEMELTIDPDNLERIEEDFHKMHEDVFAVSDPGSPVEIIGWVASVSCPMRADTNPRLRTDAPQPHQTREVRYLSGEAATVHVYDYAGLPEDAAFEGPAIVEMPLSTIVVEANSTLRRSSAGALLIDLHYDR